MGGEYPGSIWNPSPHYFSGHGSQKWIILHGTAGFTTAQQVANYFHNDNPPTSVHYIIGRDGTVIQCVSESDSAWGNGVISKGADSWWTGNPNYVTLSIEHVKSDPGNVEALTSAQQTASFKLIAYLCKKHGIRPLPANSSGGITGHYSIDPVNRKFCPGTYPWTALWQYLGDPANISGAPGGNTISGLNYGTGSGSGSGGFDVQTLINWLTSTFPFLSGGWIKNAGINLVKIILGGMILGLVMLGLVINIVGSDILGVLGGSGKGVGKAVATFAAVA